MWGWEPRISSFFFLTSQNFNQLSVQFSRSVVSNSLWPHEPQHTRPPCPSPTPGVHPNPYPLSRWCHPPSHPLSSPSPPALNLSQHQGLFRWVSSSHQMPKYWSFSFSINPSSEIQDWFPSVLTGWLSLMSKGLSRISSNTAVQKHPFFGAQLSL